MAHAATYLRMFIRFTGQRFPQIACRNFSTASNNPDVKELNPVKLPLVKELQKQYAPHQAYINYLFKKQPVLIKSNFKEWTMFIKIMNKYDYTIKNCLDIIMQHPEVLQIDPIKLNDVVKQWHEAKLDMFIVKTLLMNYPELFYVQPKEIRKRIPTLQSYSSKKKSFVLWLLKCPNIIYESWDEVLRKIRYLSEDMRQENFEITRCYALSYPLQYLKMRYSLLEKCGIFVKPPLMPHKRTSRNLKGARRNPTVKEIVDTDDEVFARNFAKISLEEYEVYEQMFESTDFDELNSDSDTDSDLDTDSDDND